MKKANSNSKNVRFGNLVKVFVIALVILVNLGYLSADQNGEEQLAKTHAAHGGLENWTANGSLSYVMTDFPLSPQIAERNLSTVDLVNRNNRIENENYTVGFDGENAWSLPAAKSAGLPSRFVTLGSFYFVGIPFVLADPGVNIESIGKQEFRGKEYEVLVATFEGNVGHTPDDNYQIFIDPDSNCVALINHNVTELYDEKVRVTWVYNEYQRVNDIYLPSKLTFYKGWPLEENAKGNTYTVTEYKLGKNRPEPSIYEAPSSAILNDSK